MKEMKIIFLFISFIIVSFANAQSKDIEELPDSIQAKNKLVQDSLNSINTDTIEHIKKIFKNHKGQRPTIGLALAGGGAKGFAHTGVLELLDSLDIPVDYIAGNSMGGLVAALYSIGYSGKDLEEYVSNLNWKYLLNDSPKRATLPFIEKKKNGMYQLSVGLDGFRPAVPSGLVYGQNVQMEFLSLTAPYEDVHDFNKLPIPFRCVAVDLATGKEVILKRGSLSKSMRATMSIPSAFSPVDWSNYLLVDGLVLNNFPVDVVKDMGADIVIGLNLTTGTMNKEKLRDIFSILDRTIDIPTRDKLAKNIENSDIYIDQDLEGFSTTDFTSEKISQIIERGKEAGKRNIDVFIALKEELEKYNDYQEWVKNGKDAMRKSILEHREAFKNSSPKIDKINIVGNDKIESEFIRDYLRIKVGETFSVKKMESQISALYALNYFETVNYSFSKNNKDGIDLTINIKEKKFNKIVAGFRYDDHFKLVGLLGVETNSAVIKGAQMEAYVRFGGLTQFDITLLYPSRSMDIPVYPFIKARYKDLPISFYLDGKKLFRYNNRSSQIVGGFNFSLSKFWDLETSVFLEKMNVATDIASEDIDEVIKNQNPDAKIVAGRVKLLFDSLDDVILPTEGLYLKALFEISMKDANSDIQYHKYSAFGKFFLPITSRHNLSFTMYYAFASANTPFYKWFYIGGPNTFVGIDYFQANGTEFTVSQVSYRFEFMREFYIRGVYNIMFNYNMGDSESPIRGKPILGGGFSLIMNTMFGKAELMWSRGYSNMYAPSEMSNKIYFNFGYNLF